MQRKLQTRVPPESPRVKQRPSSYHPDGPGKLPRHTICINLSDCKYEVIRHVCKSMLNWQIITNDETNMNCDIMWNDTACNQDLLGGLKPYQKLNHFPGIFTIARKNFLAANLKKMKKQFPEHYDFFPLTYCMPYEKNLVFKEYEDKEKIANRIFIVKPEASSQGKGIFLARRLDEIPLNDGFVVQKYCKQPLLIDNLKFDLRIYVLITSVAPLRIYLYKEGLARFATEEYTTPNAKNMANMCQHLTNYAVNKFSKKFQFDSNPDRAETGHKRSMSSVWRVLESQGVDTSIIWQRIQKAIIKTICSIQPILKHIYVSSQPDDFTTGMCFEILGFDVLIKKNLKPIVLEVNHAPSFNSDTPYDFKIKSTMLKNAFEILDVSIDRRNLIIERERIKFQERFRQGVRTKVPQEEKDRLKAQYLSELEDKIEPKLGLFELIYPPINPEEPYDEFMSFSEKVHLAQTGVDNSKKKPKPATEKPNQSLIRKTQAQEHKENKSQNAIDDIRLKQKVKYEQIQETVNRLFLRNEKKNNMARQRLEKAKTYELETKARLVDSLKPNVVTFDFSKIGNPFN
jgi:tubulin polyglutamylase TTLL6/13